MYISGKKILLGITGGIAAYKVAELCRFFIKEDALVKVIMTRAATEFITPLTFESLTGNQVFTDLFPKSTFSATHHIDLADWADLVVIAPATANSIAKLNAGIADDLLSTVMLAVHSPIVIAPAMNTHMWHNPVTMRNISALKELGMSICPPESGDLACGYTGDGRLSPTDQIVAYCNQALAPSDLAGKKVLVNSGPTLEDIDSVRFLSNRSSGKMGYAMAYEAFCRGADVTLISGPSAMDGKHFFAHEKVRNAEEMSKAVHRLHKKTDIFIAASAVADFKPLKKHIGKIKKESTKELKIDLIPTDDILLQLTEKKGKKMHIGFALETDDVEENALKKLKNKKLDAIVLNNPLEDGSGFEYDTNRVTIYTSKGAKIQLPLSSKFDVASRIFDNLAYLWSK